MGTWSNKPFGNDAALDWLSELEDSEFWLEKIKNSLAAANNSNYIDARIAEEAIAAAAIVAAGSIDRVSGIYKDAKLWIERSAFSPDRELKESAMAALSNAASNSELKDLWEESESLEGWVNEINKIYTILEQYLDVEPPTRSAKKQRLPRSIGKLVDLYLKNKEPKVEQKIIEKLSKVDDPNAQDSSTDFDLPLNIAAKTGLTSAIKSLIENGANVNAASGYGYKPLTVACRHGHPLAVKMLLENGAHLFDDYPLYDEEGNVEDVRKVCIPILSSSRNGTPELIQVLVDYGADIEETDLNGETLLHKASESGNLKVINYLIISGLDVNKHKGLINGNERSQGESPLHYAVKANQFLAAKLLIEHGANINALEYFIGTEHTWFKTPLDLLPGNKQSELYQLLKSKGALRSCEMKEPDKITKSYA